MKMNKINLLSELAYFYIDDLEMDVQLIVPGTQIEATHLHLYQTFHSTQILLPKLTDYI